MQIPKLIALLQTFTKEEMKSFADYVQSPYFNKLEAPVNLYKALVPLHPDFENLKWEKLFKKAFPEKTAFNEPYLRNVLSDLNTLAEDFLGQQLTQQSAILLANSAYMLTEKKQYKMAEDRLVKMKSAIKETAFQSANLLMQYYHLLKMRLHDRQEQRLAYSEAQQQLATLLKKQIITDAELRYYEMNNDHEVYYQYPYELDFYERFANMIQIQDIADDVEISCVHYRLLLQTEKTWYDWHNLYEHVKNNKSKMTDVSMFIGNQALTNHLIDRSRKEKLPDEVVAKGFLLYEDMIAIRQRNGYEITGSLFENIVSYGSMLYGTKWGRNYIAQNKEKLPENIRTGLCAYCLARSYFTDANYTEAIAISANATPFYHHYYFHVKSLMLLAYYELDDYDAFMGTLETFKKTLAAHPELAQKHQTAHSNMNALLLKLYRLRLKYSPKAAQELQQLLQDPDLPLFSRDWAELKLSQLLPNTPTHA